MFWNSSQYHNLETLGARQLSFFNQARRNCPDFQDKLTCRAQSPGQVSLRIGRLEFWMSRLSHLLITLPLMAGLFPLLGTGPVVADTATAVETFELAKSAVDSRSTSTNVDRGDSGLIPIRFLEAASRLNRQF